MQDSVREVLRAPLHVWYIFLMTQNTDLLAALDADALDALAQLVAALGAVDVVDVEVEVDYDDVCENGHPIFDNGECSHLC